tara:strand:- start:10359 stop:11333 length:975 start_codon:yes stop_codon:yes gene_type:complete
MSPEIFSRRLNAYQELINLSLLEIVKGLEPNYLYNPIRYVLSGQGKRLRPALVFVTADGFGVDENRTLPAAMAVEILHNFSLVHDDIMDNDDFRHGKQTVHQRWDISTAILAGDGIFCLAYDQLNRLDGLTSSYLKIFSNSTIRLCEGQALDKDFESRQKVSLDEYLEMVSLKTGTLLSLCCKLGGILGGASDHQINSLGEFGLQLGKAFQIQDDILEIYSNVKDMGKSLGSDILTDKKTFLTIKAAEMNPSEWYSFKKGLKDYSLIESRLKMRNYFEIQKILEDARLALRSLSDDSLLILNELPKKVQHNLTSFLEFLMQRKN